MINMSTTETLNNLMSKLHSKTSYKICLDAGHYGKYNQSPCNPLYTEAETVWGIVETMALHLSNFPNIEVVKTRTNQTKDLSLTKRGEASSNCDLFISIHTNACGTQSVDYATSLVYTGDTDIDLLSQYFGENLSQVCKDTLQLSSSKTMKKLSSNGKSEYYGVLRGAKGVSTPGLILECGFHTNPSTVSKLLDIDVRNNLAIAIANEVVYLLQGDLIPRVSSVNKVEEVSNEDQTSNLTNSANGSNGVNSTISSNSSNDSKDPIIERGKRVFKELNQYGLSLEGIAGIMGNMEAESSLYPNNLQNTFNKKLQLTDEEYTDKVNSNSYTNFIKDGAGYGLCQWTYWTRKQALLNYVNSLNLPIDSIEGQVGFLISEFKSNYKGVYNIMLTASDVETASNAFLLNYERPADQSKAVQTKRTNMSLVWYSRIIEWINN